MHKLICLKLLRLSLPQLTLSLYSYFQPTDLITTIYSIPGPGAGRTDEITVTHHITVTFSKDDKTPTVSTTECSPQLSPYSPLIPVRQLIRSPARDEDSVRTAVLCLESLWGLPSYFSTLWMARSYTRWKLTLCRAWWLLWKNSNLALAILVR
jgi:hypothetical protein